MTRLIDADALLDEVDTVFDSVMSKKITDLITNAPTVQREGWYDDESIAPLPDDYTILGKRYLYMGWCAATTEANKRMAELESELTDTRNAYHESRTEFYAMQASNNDLKDALYVAFAYCPDDESFDYIETLLATTPAESLQALKEVK